MNALLLMLVLDVFCLLPVQADSFLIVPGHSIGQTVLGNRGDFYVERLPPPDGADAAMGGKRLLVWQSNTSRDTLAIFAVSREFFEPPQPDLTIQEIRVTSRRFHTRNGISPGATLAQIRQRFPRGNVSSQNGYFYLAGRAGIAFEFARKPTPAARCIAVTVYPLGPANILATDRQVQDILHSGQHS